MKYPSLLTTKLFFLLLAFILLITGCAKTHHATAAIESTNFLNPNIYQQPSPVVVIIYQLKSSTAFQQANFFALSDNAQTLLGAELLDKREIEIRPGQKQSVPMDLSPEANYIGVIAEFRDPDTAQWRQIKQIKPGKNVKLQIRLSTQNISID
ncbi:MAG TPA: type VI secretion system lipoprotein TssJ [Gammaproteobacteria bacterium]|nr:type VI secretion system lipoprotein TssJ [Gammaproteobacteria bacterium]